MISLWMWPGGKTYWESADLTDDDKNPSFNNINMS